jgi:hypothetical protein
VAARLSHACQGRAEPTAQAEHERRRLGSPDRARLARPHGRLKAPADAGRCL